MKCSSFCDGRQFDVDGRMACVFTANSVIPPDWSVGTLNKLYVYFINYFIKKGSFNVMSFCQCKFCHRYWTSWSTSYQPTWLKPDILWGIIAETKKYFPKHEWVAALLSWCAVGNNMFKSLHESISILISESSELSRYKKALKNQSIRQ